MTIVEPGQTRMGMYGEAAWSNMQWSAVLTGAFAGFAVTLILTTLGAAIGLTAADTTDGADGAAVGIGALVWWLLTVCVAGFVGGRVLAKTARRDLSYQPAIYGTMAWVLGVTILLVLLAIGVGNMIGGLGGALGVVAAEGRVVPSGSSADTAQVVQTAARVGTGAAWGLLISQILGLGATILGAGKREGSPNLPARERPVSTRSNQPTGSHT